GLWGVNMGAVWHAPSNAFLCFSIGGGFAGSGSSPTIYKLALTPGQSPLTNNAWTWSQVANDPSNTVTPATDRSDFEGVYSKLKLVNDMGNGQSALVVASSWDGPTYAYKIP